jgi:cytochrome c
MKIVLGKLHIIVRQCSPERMMCIAFCVYAFGLIVLLPFSQTLVAQDSNSSGADHGRELFERRCTGCHALDSDKEGPRLRGVYGRKAGSVPSFEYSEGLPKANITWNEDNLDKWLTDPEKFIAGAGMDFHLEKPDERSAVIAYLKQLSSK